MKLPAQLAAMLACAVVVASPAAARDRVRTIADWRVADRSEQDGGRLVTLSKSGRGWKLEHHFELWHGNGGVYVGATFRWHGCMSGEADHLFRGDEPITAEILAGRTRDYMEECGLSAAQQRRVLAGLGEANAQAQRWVDDFWRRLRSAEE